MKSPELHRLLLAAVLAANVLLCAGCTKQAPETGKIPITTSSEEAKKDFLTGRDLVDKMLTQKSTGLFEAAIAKDSNFALAYFALAQVSPTAKPFLENMKKAVALSEKASRGEYLLILGFEAGAMGNPVKQKEFYDTLVTLYPSDERAHHALADYYNGQRDYAGAVEHYKRAIELDSLFSPAYNSLGYVYKALEQYDDAERAFKKYTELIPKDPNPYDSYAELLMKMGRFDESIAQYEKALTLDPNFVSSHIGIAGDLLFKGKPDEAEARLQKLFDIARDDGERQSALSAMRILYVDGGKMDLALQETDKEYALGEKTNDAAQMFNSQVVRGRILFESGKIDEASASFQKGGKIVEESELPQVVKDNVRLGHHSEAVIIAMKKRDFKTATAEAEEFRNGVEALRNQAMIRAAHGLTGEVALEARQYDKALSEFQQADQLSPCILYKMSLAYTGKGDKAKAKELCMKAARSYVIPTMDYAVVRVKAEKMLSTR